MSEKRKRMSTLCCGTTQPMITVDRQHKQASKGEPDEQFQEVEFFAREGTGDMKLVEGTSFPKKYRRILRRPFSLTVWHVDDDPPHRHHGEVHEGGDRLRLFCQYVFIVEGVCLRSSVRLGGFET